MECAICEGRDEECPHCKNGTVEIDKCPRDKMGFEFIEACNLAKMCGKGDWPVAGGIYDQSAWFLDLHQKLKHETNQIEKRQRDT